MQLRHIAALAALLLSTPALAGHKCKDQYGRTIYQESPCDAAAKQLDDFVINFVNLASQFR